MVESAGKKAWLHGIDKSHYLLSSFFMAILIEYTKASIVNTSGGPQTT